MKSIKLSLWCAYLLVIGLQGEVWSQQPPAQEVVQRAARFADGRQISYRGRQKVEWQECEVFGGDDIRIYVDAVTGQVTTAFYPLSPPRAERIDQKTAEARVNTWLAQHDVALAGWILEERKVYDRGSAGKEYVFQWIKRSSQGVRLPCVMKVAMGESGKIHSFWRVERQAEVALEPSVKVGEAAEKARKAAGLSAAPIVRQELKVWFDDGGKQQLWWVVELRERGLERKVILDAHTGKVLLTSQSGEVNSPKAAGETVEKRISEILKDFTQVVKVEVLAYGPVVGGRLGSPTLKEGARVIGVIDKQKNKDAFRGLMGEMETTLHRGSNRLALLTPLWLRLHLQDGQWIYHCKFSPKDGYLEVLTKEPWPQKSTNKWPPEGAIEIGISCQAASRFKETVLDSLDPAARKAFSGQNTSSSSSSPSGEKVKRVTATAGGIALLLLLTWVLIRRRIG